MKGTRRFRSEKVDGSPMGEQDMCIVHLSVILRGLCTYRPVATASRPELDKEKPGRSTGLLRRAVCTRGCVSSIRAARGWRYIAPTLPRQDVPRGEGLAFDLEDIVWDLVL
jgi:hypothetical protein